MKHVFILLLVLVTLPAATFAQGIALGGESDLFGGFTLTSEITASAVASHLTAQPGTTFHVAINLSIADGWAYYSPNPGKTVKPAVVTVDAGKLKAGETLWPADKRYDTDLGDRTITNYAYKNNATVFVPINIPPGTPSGTYTIKISAGGQVCGKLCKDIVADSTATIKVSETSQPNPAWTSELESKLKQAVPQADLPLLRPAPITTRSQDVQDLTIPAGLALALLAGLILNIMPCVLPVIPLRILSLTQMAGESRRRMVTLGLTFAFGILLFFVAIAGVNIVLRLVAEQVFSLSGLFQYRAVRIGLGLVLVALAANLFGLYNVIVPASIAGLDAGKRKGTHAYLSSIGMGLMLAILATPCSFAILAKALAWAQVVSLPLGTLAILTIGVGMALPHAVLAAFPGLVDKLPRPGRWMELFKQSMGFLLLPVVIWLVFAGSGDSYPAWVMGYCVLLVFCLWVWGTWVRYDAPLARKLTVRGSVLAVAIIGGVWMLSPATKSPITFVDFSNADIAEAHAQGKTVLVKFTSATCLSCIWIDRTVYRDPEVAKELLKRGIVTMKGDVTDAHSPAAKMLSNRFGGAPPLTVILPPGNAKPHRIEGKFTREYLIKTLDLAQK